MHSVVGGKYSGMRVSVGEAVMDFTGVVEEGLPRKCRLNRDLKLGVEERYSEIFLVC